METQTVGRDRDVERPKVHTYDNGKEVLVFSTDRPARSKRNKKKKQTVYVFVPLKDKTQIKLQHKNPKKEGSESYKRYEAYKEAKTLKEYRQKGGRRTDASFDIKNGSLQILTQDRRDIVKPTEHANGDGSVSWTFGDDYDVCELRNRQDPDGGLSHNHYRSVKSCMDRLVESVVRAEKKRKRDAVAAEKERKRKLEKKRKLEEEAAAVRAENKRKSDAVAAEKERRRKLGEIAAEKRKRKLERKRKRDASNLAFQITTLEETQMLLAYKLMRERTNPTDCNDAWMHHFFTWNPDHMGPFTLLGFVSIPSEVDELKSRHQDLVQKLQRKHDKRAALACKNVNLAYKDALEHLNRINKIYNNVN